MYEQNTSTQSGAKNSISILSDYCKTFFSVLSRGNEKLLKGQCPDYAHARASSVFPSKDNRTVKLTRQDFLPDRTADRDLLFLK